MSDYNKMELMIAVASRELEDGASVAVGTGAPCAAAMLAQKIHAPDPLILFEAGGVDPRLPEMPISVGDSRSFYEACMAGSMGEIMNSCARGFVDYTFLGGAQIDMYGNLNSTIIGDDYRFVEKVDYGTTPGWLDGGDSRQRSGLPLDSGPYRIITDMGVMDFEPVSKRMRVISVNPGYTFDDIQQNCGFELLQAESVIRTPPPSDRELHVLRTEVDPYGYIIGRS